VFYVNLPVGAAAFALLTRYLHVPAQRRPARIDFLGAGLLAAGVSAILLVTTWAGDRYAWGSAPIVGLGGAAVLLLAAFVVREQVAPEPVLPLRLLRDPVFVVVSGALFVTTLSLFAAIVFLPVFLQLVTGASATKSGLLVLPLLGASAVSTVASGWIISRTGRYKVFPVTGLALMTAGLLALSTLDESSSRLTAALFMAVFGAGFGMVTQVLMVAILNAVEPREIGTATASANLFRALGGAVGVAIYGAVFTSGLRQWLPRKLPGGLPPGIDPHGIQVSPGRIHAFAPSVQHGIAQAVAASLHDVFLVATPISLAGFLLVLALREVPLRGRGAPGRTAKRTATSSEPTQTTA
jgi:predicted MFS family arabinose efflux permease